MSEKNIKNSINTKLSPPSLIKDSQKNRLSLKNNAKMDNLTINQNNKNQGSINVLNIANKITEKKLSKKKNSGNIYFNFSFKKGQFLNESKILKHFLSFFNIRELFIIMEIDTHIHNAIKNSDVFKKYLSIRKDFILRNKINQNKKINNIISNTDIKNNDIKNNNKNKVKSISRKYYEKYNQSDIKDPVSLGFNGILVVYPTKAGEKERLEKEIKDEKIEEVEYTEEIEKSPKLKLNLPSLDFSKLGISYLINNNCQNIKKYFKTLSLNNFQSHSIFNGILEYLIMMENGIPFENTSPKIFSLQNSRALNGLNYYAECLINLDYPNITQLDLNNVGISSVQIMKKLCYIFHKYSNTLRVLYLSNNGIDDKCAKLLFPGLQNSSVLEVLNLSNNNIGNEGLKYGEIFFSANKSLQTLIFDHNLIGPIGGEYLFNFLKSNPHLNIKSIDIGYNGLTKEGTEFLGSFSLNNDTVVTLNIGGNYFCDEGIEEICEYFSQKTSKNIISYLNLENNNISKIGCEYIYKILMESPFINGICLRNNFLNNEGAIKILSYINSENSRLVNLDLTDTRIDEKTLKYISETINKNVILQKLILSNNNFKQAGIYIKNILVKETNLKHVIFAYCEINNQFDLIFEGLGKNKTIKTIDFSGNRIPMKNEILKVLTNSIISNNFLINLFLDNCNIDDIGMSFINKGLEKNHQIKTLSLNNNYLTSKCIPGLIKGIEKSAIINKIYLIENKSLNKKYIYEIEKQLSANKSNFIPKRNDIN